MTDQHSDQQSAAAGGRGEPKSYRHWGEVPWSLATRGQLTKADLPREPKGPVRGYVPGVDFRGKEDMIELFAVAESVPTKATARQLEAADRRRSTTVRVCSDCGANCQSPLAGRRGRYLCAMCAKIARIVDYQLHLRERRAVLAAWARQVLEVQALAVVWVEVMAAPRTPAGRLRPPLAARVEAVDAAGKRLVDVLVRLAGPRTEGAPSEALPPDAGAKELQRALEDRRVLTWTWDALAPVTDRLAALGHRVRWQRVPLAPQGREWDGWQPSVCERVSQWRGELDPATGTLRQAWAPGTADRLHLLLRRMAATVTEAGREGYSVRSKAGEVGPPLWSDYAVRVAVTGPAEAGERLAQLLADQDLVDARTVTRPVPSREVPGASVRYMAVRPGALAADDNCQET